jgi:hypothetical protein
MAAFAKCFASRQTAVQMATGPNLLGTRSLDDDRRYSHGKGRRTKHDRGIPATIRLLQSGVELPFRAINRGIGDSLNAIVRFGRRRARGFVSKALKIQRGDSEID